MGSVRQRLEKHIGFIEWVKGSQINGGSWKLVMRQVEIIYNTLNGKGANGCFLSVY